MKSELYSLALSVVAFSTPLCVNSADFTPLGDLDGGAFNSSGLAISSDGSTTVGRSISAAGDEAFSWTSGGGMAGLGDLAGGDFLSNAHGVSNGGSTIVGEGNSTSGTEAFIWTGSIMMPMGHLAGGGTISIAGAISDDGATVVGQSDSTLSLITEAFIWTSGTGMVPLGDLPGGALNSYANDVSGDGSSVTGAGESASGIEAFLWNSGGSMVGLGDLAGGLFNSIGHGISNDGTTVVGTSASALGLAEAFIWTSGNGISPLGDLPDVGDLPPDNHFHSDAWAVSGDGSIVVGTGTRVGNTEAFVWTQATGMKSVFDVATSQGAAIPAGWTLKNAYSISADGTRIVGDGTNPSNQTEAWIITGLQLQDDDNDGIINIEDNCINVPNGPLILDAGGKSQYDSNGDGYGNACDADLTGVDLVVNGLDVGPFVAQFGTTGPDADFNGDGVVNGLDVGTFVNSFGQAPGPSGTAP